MTSISSTNTTALAILQRMNPSRGAGSETTADTSISALGPLEPIGNASKQAAAARVFAMLNEHGTTIDLSAFRLANSSVSVGENATSLAGDRNASLDASDAAVLYALNHAVIWSGSGNDYTSVQNNANVHAGGGNDVVRAYNHATVDAGDGNDWVSVYRNAVVDGGAGNDEIRTYDDSTVDAGDGDDFVVTLGNSTINGGAGNDTLVVTDNRSNVDSTFDNANVDGGDGDDYIQVNANSTVTGGTGNDTIRVLGDSTTVNFQKGDGQDAIGIGQAYLNTWANTTINISGYSAKDVTLSQSEDGVKVTFKGSDDSLTLQFERGSAHLAFEDGSSLDVKPTRITDLQQIDASADALAGQEKPLLHF